MRNLEQIRAANALNAGKQNFRGVNDGQVVKKVPAMIRENGLLAALAFAVEKNDKGKLKHDGHYGIWQAIIAHLASDGINRKQNSTPEALIADLSVATAACLRDITEEALAYLNYLRRFAQEKED